MPTWNPSTTSRTRIVVASRLNRNVNIILNPPTERWVLKELIAYLQKVYCGKIGYEYTHLTSVVRRDWIRD